MLAFELSRFI